MRNGSVAAADGDGGGVRRAGGKGDVGLAAARNSGVHRSDIFGVGTGEQGRKREVDVAGLVGVENVSAILYKFKSVSGVESIGSCSDGAGATSGAGAGEDPKSLVGAILAGIDIEDQLRLGFAPPPSPQRQTTAANKEKLRLILIYCFITVPVKNLFVSNRSAATCQSLKREKKEKS